MKKRFVLALSVLLLASITCYSHDWKTCEGISSQVSISAMQKEGGLYASGTKMWREGQAFHSEPALYTSEDGSTWQEAIYPKCSMLSSYNVLFFAGKRILAAGRKGETQLDWVGAVCYSDDNGNTWKQSEGIPENISITSIYASGSLVIALGQRQWREGYMMYSEPKAYVSLDMGASWNNYVTITDQLSSISSAIDNNNRILVTGRVGQAQMNWVGGVFYTDNQGSQWNQSTGIDSDVSITTFAKYKDMLVALGQKQWMENYQMHSEPKAYISKDNGQTWGAWIEIPSQLTSISAVYLEDNKIFLTGRIGEAGIDWVGGVLYTNL